MSEQLICPHCFRVNDNPRNVRRLHRSKRGMIETETRAECEHCDRSFHLRSITVSDIRKLYSALLLGQKVRILGMA